MHLACIRCVPAPCAPRSIARWCTSRFLKLSDLVPTHDGPFFYWYKIHAQHLFHNLASQWSHPWQVTWSCDTTSLLRLQPKLHFWTLANIRNLNIFPSTYSSCNFISFATWLIFLAKRISRSRHAQSVRVHCMTPTIFFYFLFVSQMKVNTCLQKESQTMVKQW